MKAKNLILGLGACLLVGATATIGYGSEGFKNWNLETWFQSTEENPEEPNEENGMIVDGKVQTEKTAYFSSMPGNVMFRSLSVDQAMTINVTVLPETAYNKTLKWKLDNLDLSTNPSVLGWNISISADTHSISIKPTMAFTSTTTLTATTTDGSNISQSCTLDYLGRDVSDSTGDLSYSGDITQVGNSFVGEVLDALKPGWNSTVNRVSGGSINGTIQFTTLTLSAHHGDDFTMNVSDVNNSTDFFTDTCFNYAEEWLNADYTITINYNLIYNDIVYSTGSCEYTGCFDSDNLASVLKVQSLGFSTTNVQF